MAQPAGDPKNHQKVKYIANAAKVSLDAPLDALVKKRADLLVSELMTHMISKIKEAKPKFQASTADAQAQLIATTIIPRLENWQGRASSNTEKEHLQTLLTCFRALCGLGSPVAGFGGSKVADLTIVMRSLKSSVKTPLKVAAIAIDGCEYLSSQKAIFIKHGMGDLANAAELLNLEERLDEDEQEKNLMGSQFMDIMMRIEVMAPEMRPLATEPITAKFIARVLARAKQLLDMASIVPDATGLATPPMPEDSEPPAPVVETGLNDLRLDFQKADLCLRPG